MVAKCKSATGAIPKFNSDSLEEFSLATIHPLYPLFWHGTLWILLGNDFYFILLKTW